MRLAIKYTLATVLVMLFAVRSYADDAPMKVVSVATSGVLKALIDTTPDDRDPQLVERLVANYILPAIDQEKIAMGALGKYWRRATPEERQRFITIFRERQMKTYGGAFKAFSGETLTFSETRYSDDGGRAVVKGEFTQSSGSKVPVDFRLYLNKDSGQWLVYDAVISGLSMVKTYRTQLSDRLQTISIAELLVELENEPIQPVAAKDS